MAAQRARLKASDREGFKQDLLKSVQLYADVEAGRTCMGSPIIAENVLAGIEHEIDILVRGVVPAPPPAGPTVWREELQFEVQRKLAAYDENKKLRDALEAAWGLIANANEGDWEKAHPDWYAAAVRWRDAYHRILAERAVPAPQEGPP